MTSVCSAPGDEKTIAKYLERLYVQTRHTKEIICMGFFLNEGVSHHFLMYFLSTPTLAFLKDACLELSCCSCH